MLRFIAAVVIIVFYAAIISGADTHVFWFNYDKITGHPVSDLTASNPGPGLPADALFHGGLIVSGSNNSNYPSTDVLNFGQGPASGPWVSSASNRCAFFWSRDLSQFKGSANSAKIRAEYRDGFSGNPFNIGGTMLVRKAVVDFQSNMDNWAGLGTDTLNAAWTDDANPLAPTMAFNAISPELMACETTQVVVPPGRTVAADPLDPAPGPLDGKFMEVDVTSQVQWILGHTAVSGAQGALSGQYAIVLLVDASMQGVGDTGKVNAYAAENGVLPTASPGATLWTQDGNTAHLVVVGDLISVEKAPLKAVMSGVFLSQNSPNPFKPKTSFSYSTDSRNGMVQIFDASGRLVHTANVLGKGSIEWDATKMVSGVYMYRLTVGSKVFSRKMVLMQ